MLLPPSRLRSVDGPWAIGQMLPDEGTERGGNTVITTREWAVAGDPAGTAKLAARAWAPAGSEPTWLAILVHGYGEHLGRYHAVAEDLIAAGAVVYGADHRGHGNPRESGSSSTTTAVWSKTCTGSSPRPAPPTATSLWC